MEINKYDQYIPEKELDTNFKITRKRTAEESFGPYNTYQQKSMLDANAPKLPAYGYDGAFQNPLQNSGTPQQTSLRTDQFSNSNQMGMIEYPKRLMPSKNFNNTPGWPSDSSNSSYFNKNRNDQGTYNSGGYQSFWTRRDNYKGVQGQSDIPLGWNNTASVTNDQGRNSGYSRNFNNSGGFNKNSNNSFNAGAKSPMDFGYGNSGDTLNKNDRGWTGPGNRSNEGNKNFNRYWKKPDKPKPNTRPLAIPDKTDESLPVELREMFQPLFCKLCSMQFTSNVMAKMHYVSKNHEKKIRKYLIEYAEKTGEPLHPRAAVTAAEKKEKEEDKDPRNFYCELCDLQLTGKQHADSHYMGKSHNAVRLGKKKPGGKGYFDQNGKWVRSIKEQKSTSADGEDNFGMDFKKKPEEADVVKEANTNPLVKTKMQFTCSLCVVSCVSQEQLDIHLGGSKHRKKLKLQGLSPESFILPKDTNQEEVENFTTEVSDNVFDDSLKSKYITPNGFYYCEKCNLTVNSEIQFKQHLASKNHAKKANEK